MAITTANKLKRKGKITYLSDLLRAHHLIKNLCLLHRIVCLYLYSKQCYTVLWEAHTKILQRKKETI